ncbi:hypothetical protein U1Q18_006482 [Sarracenia purpurea var. burkii]
MPGRSSVVELELRSFKRFRLLSVLEIKIEIRGESEGDDEDDDEKMLAIVFQRLQFGSTGFPFFVVCLCYNHCLCNRNLASSPSSIIGFSGDFFFSELRSGDGLAREVDGDAAETLRSENRKSASASPEKEDMYYTTRGSVAENGGAADALKFPSLIVDERDLYGLAAASRGAGEQRRRREEAVASRGGGGDSEDGEAQAKGRAAGGSLSLGAREGGGEKRRWQAQAAASTGGGDSKEGEAQGKGRAAGGSLSLGAREGEGSRRKGRRKGRGGGGGSVFL